MEKLNYIAEKISKDLIAIDMGKSSVLISLPVLYPSGSTVVVSVEAVGENFFISDMGLGFQEADMMGATIMFRNSARMISERVGVGFDEHSIFVSKASRDQLIGAIISVAKCSNEATVITAYKLAEKKHSDNTNILYERLIGIFDPNKVHKHVEYKGASQTKWDVDLVVSDDRNELLFESVSKHHSSLAHTVMKFSDISRLEFPPRRIAVVKDKKEFGTTLDVLSSTGDVIEARISDEKIKQMAEAA